MNQLSAITSFKTKLEPHKAQLKAKWRALQPRERVMLQVLTGFVLICVLWFGMWQPLQQARLNAEQRLQNAVNQATLIQQQVARIQALQSAGSAQQTTVVNQQELPGLLNRTAAALELQITRVQSQNESRVLVFDEANFDRLLQLIDTLEQNGVTIENLDVSETNQPGIVRVRRLQVSVAL